MNYIFLSLLLCSFCSLASTSNISVRNLNQLQNSANSVLFAAEDSHSYFFALDADYENQGFRVAATAWHEKRDGQASEHKLELAEFLYDFSIADWQLSLGKKKVDWGVGYGFRPLDLFSPIDPLAINTAVAAGTWQLSADWFSSDGTWTTLCNQSQAFYKVAGQQQDKSLGCGARYYGYFDQWELQGLAHYDQDMKLRFGGSALSVLNDNLEVHASILWQHTYLGAQFTPPDLTATEFVNPVESLWQQGALQSLMGVNFSTSYGVTLIAEYWFDGRSPSKNQWKNMIKGLNAQVATRASNPLSRHYIAAQQQLFSSQNLFKNNLMLHARYSYNSWRPELTLLLNPDDLGLSVNAKMNYIWPNGHAAQLGLKRYLGPADSIYKQLDFDTTAYAGFTLVF